MELSRKSCRLCLSEAEFNVSLFGNYSRRSNILNKIVVCLNLVVDEADVLNTICYKCADNIEKYYEFLTFIKKCQSQLGDKEKHETRSRNAENISPNPINRRHITSYVREQLYDADYTFSFLEMPKNEEKKETKPSSPFFSYFSPPNNLMKQTSESAWKSPRPRLDASKSDRSDSKLKRQCRQDRGRHHSRDLFESQSQEVEDADAKSLDWRLTPDDNLMRRVREKCFGRSDF